MATKEKDSSTLKKEKVTTPSNSHANVKQRSLKQTTSGSTDKKPTPSGKSVPNYLNPTISSRPESLKYVKKTGQEDATQKATLLRRRSFDRPPSATRIQRSLISPDPKERVASRDRTIAVRPTATSSKTGSSPKPVLERSSRSLKPVKSQGPATTTINRSTSPSRRTGLSTKNGSSFSLSSKDPTNDDISQTLDLKISQESNKESLLDDSVEALNFESEVPELSSDIPKAVDKEHIDAADTQVSNGEDEKLKPSEILMVSEGHQEAHVEEPESQLHEEESEKQQGEEENTVSESANGHHDEGIADETKVEADKDNAKENVNENVASTEESVDEKKRDDIKQVDEGSEAIKRKDGEVVVASSVEEVKPEEAADNGEKKRQGGQGKKESLAAYNDVIEETKNKLLEKRKNKVKALVGAFETVIDYESGSK